MKPLLIFDLDGTLADTSYDLSNALNRILIKNKISPVTHSSVKHLISQGAVGLLVGGFGSAFHAFPEERKHELIEEFVEAYEDLMLDEVKLYAGVKEALELLKNQGFQMAICSNKNTGLVENILDYLEIRHYFPAVCGGDKFVGIKKPHRGHVEGTILEAGFGISPAKAIFIGDAMTDVKAAKNTEIPCIFATYGYRDVEPENSGADEIVDQFSEVPPAILKLTRKLEMEIETHEKCGSLN